MKVGFLILNFNSWELSIKLAEKISRYEYVDKVVIVDNCSTDDSYKRLESCKTEKIDIIKSEKNGGYSYGNNYGAEYCRKLEVDILFISNPDVDVDEKDVNLIINKFKVSDYTILTGVEYDIHKNMSHPPIWKQMDYKDDLMDCFFVGRRLCRTKQGIELDRSKGIQDAEIVKGSFFAVRLEDFLSVGGFDENTFLFCEERILGKRMEMAEKKLGVVTEAKYFHNHSVSINKAYKGVSRQMKLLYNSRLYYHRVYSKVNWIKYWVLFFSMKISLIEYCLVDLVKTRGK